jgi:hypothetical protein
MAANYPYCDWMTPLDENKVAAFENKIYDLACREFGVDGDGDCAVSIKVIDRRRMRQYETRSELR